LHGRQLRSLDLDLAPLALGVEGGFGRPDDGGGNHEMMKARFKVPR